MQRLGGPESLGATSPRAEKGDRAEYEKMVFITPAYKDEDLRSATSMNLLVSPSFEVLVSSRRTHREMRAEHGIADVIAEGDFRIAETYVEGQATPTKHVGLTYWHKKPDDDLTRAIKAKIEDYLNQQEK